MIDTAAKTQRRKLLKQVDAMQRHIVAVHRLCLDDLAAYAARHSSAQGGRVYLDPHVFRHRLDVLVHQLSLIMRPAMASLVVTGGKAARSILEAGLRHHIKTRRQREAEDEDQQDDPPEGSADAIFGRPWADETPTSDEGRALVDQIRLPSLSAEDAHEIVLSRNRWGMTWEEQLAQSSKRVADPQAMAAALAQGTEEQLTLPKLREKLKPFVEDLSVSAQRIARTEGLRISMTAQQRQYDAADKVGIGIKGMTLHCSMGPHSAEDHKERNNRFYAKVGPAGSGQYRNAETNEIFPGTPYGHPNCMCWATPELDMDAQTQAMIDRIHRHDAERKGVFA